MKKRIITLLLCSALIASSFAACTAEPATTESSAAGNNNSTAETSKADGGDEVVVRDLSILQPMDANFPADIDPNDNEVTDVLKAELPDINIEWIMVPSNALGERKAALMGSGEFPDVVPASGSEMITWADQGIIVPLDDIYASHYPNINNFLTEEDQKAARYNGSYYGILSPVNPIENPQLGYVRQDWLENLDMEQPTTIDELYDTMYAFTFNDPDGNGEDDTYGVALNKGIDWFAKFLMSPFGVFTGQWSTVDGEIVPDIIRPEMKEYLVFLNKLYEEGIMHPDSLVFDGGDVHSNFVQGTTGFVNYGSWDINSSMANDVADINPGAVVNRLETVPAADGEKYVMLDSSLGGFGGSIRVVTVACEDPTAALDYANWIIGEDDSVAPIFSLNSDKFYFGADKDCLVELGGKFYSELGISELDAETQVLRSMTTSYRWHYGSWQNLDDAGMVEFCEAQTAEGLMGELNAGDKNMAADYGHQSEMKISGPVYADKWSDINTYWNEVKVGIISGTMEPEAFEDWTKFFYDNGGQEIIDEITEMNK